MSKKHFSWLLAVTAVVATVVLLVPNRTGRDSAFEPIPLLPELPKQVNEIDWLRLTGPGNEVIATLERTGERWTVEEAQGYPADWSRLRGLLLDLAEAEIIEPKTSNSAYYDRLGVESVAGEDAGGVLVEFAPERDLPALVIGKTAQGREGQYVRRQDEAASFLVDRRFDLPGERREWLLRTIVDVSDDEVVDVVIRHADGEVVRAARSSADETDFVLQDIPEGREIRSKWTVNSMANSLASLMLDAVRPVEEIDWSGSTVFRLLSADGLELKAELVALTASPEAEEEEKSYWLRLDVEAAAEPESEVAVEQGAETSAESVAPANRDSEAGLPPSESVTADDSADPAESTRERAENIASRVSGWAYEIPKYKYDAMTKRMEDLLAEPDVSE